MASVTGNRTHIGFDFFFDPAALRLPETALQIVDNPFKLRHIGSATIFVAAFQFDLLTLGPIEQNINHFWRKFLNRRIQGKMIVLCQRMHIHRGNGAALHCPAAALYPALVDGQGFIRQHQVRVDLHKDPQSGTFGAGPIRVIKGEHPGGQLFDTCAVLWASVVLTEGIIFFRCADDHNSPSQGGRCFNRIR